MAWIYCINLVEVRCHFPNKFTKKKDHGFHLEYSLTLWTLTMVGEDSCLLIRHPVERSKWWGTKAGWQPWRGCQLTLSSLAQVSPQWYHSASWLMPPPEGPRDRGTQASPGFLSAGNCEIINIYCFSWEFWGNLFMATDKIDILEHKIQYLTLRILYTYGLTVDTAENRVNVGNKYKMLCE